MKHQNIKRPSRFLFAATAFAAAAVLGGGDLLAQTTPGPQPSICSRSCWNARAGSAPEMSALNRAVIHHTASSSDYNTTSQSTSASKVRSHQNFHMDVNGWPDIGYHFLVDKLGNIFEGRVRSLNTSQRPRGTHDSNNTNSFGFSVMGYYHPSPNQSFTTASRNSLWDVIAWRMPSGWSPYGSGTYNGKTVGRVAGHRNVKSTACPGDIVYGTIGTNFSGGTARNAIAARRSGGGGGGPPPNGAQNVALAANAGGSYLYIAQKKTDGNLVIQRTDLASKAWSSQFALGQATWSKTAGPALVGLADGRMMIAAVKEDGRLFTRLKAATGLINEGWGAWEEHGQPTWSKDTGPAAVLRTNGQVTILAVKQAGGLYHRTFTPSTNTWNAFTEHGQATWSPMAKPCLIAGTDGRLHLLAIKQNGALYSRSWTSGGGWTGFILHGAENWSHVGGIAGVARANGVVTWGAIKLDSNFNMYHRTWNGSSWNSGFTHHGSGFAPYSVPGFGVVGNDRVYVFGTKTNNVLYHRFWTSGGGWSGWASHGDGWSPYVGPATGSVPSGGLIMAATKDSSVLQTQRLVPFFDTFWWEDPVTHGDGWVK